MPIRAVKQRSDRGKIKDIASSISSEIKELDIPPTPYEIRMQKLYEFAETYKNKELQSSLGFITTNYVADKNAIPLTAYRIRQIVNEIKSKSPDAINNLSQQMSWYIQDEIGAEAVAYLNNKKRIKTASVRKCPSFWRVSKT